MSVTLARPLAARSWQLPRRFAHKLSDASVDSVSTPDPVSNIRQLSLPQRPEFTPQMNEYRRLREETLEWHHQVWQQNNELYTRSLAEFEQQVTAEKGYVVAADRAVFYQQFLDESYGRQTAYYREWIGRLVTLVRAGICGHIHQAFHRR
ncbi:Apoptogenic protein 1, mitochondrial [Sorochytrium milnesiophthora]